MDIPTATYLNQKLAAVLPTIVKNPELVTKLVYNVEKLKFILSYIKRNFPDEEYKSYLTILINNFSQRVLRAE